MTTVKTYVFKVDQGTITGAIPALTIDILTKRYMSEHDINDYRMALHAVLNNNPQLKQAYAQS